MPMVGRFRTFTLTMSGASQPLSDGLPDPTVGGPDDVSCQEIHLYNPTANAAVLVGGPTLSATDFGWSIAAAAGKEYPCNLTCLKPSDLYVRGTGTQKLHVTLITH
jgi:hypothetical protein